MFDTQGRCSYANAEWDEYIGAKAGATDGEGLFGFVHPDDLASFMAECRRGSESGARLDIEFRLRGKDQNYRWHRFRAVPIQASQSDATQWLGVGIDIENEKRNQSKGAEVQIELNRTKDELEKTVAERTHQLEDVVEQLEAFAYSIAHDMRAPLRAMHQYAQIVANDFSAEVPPDARPYLNKIMAASEKLDFLIREVLVYTRVSQGRMEMAPISLERLLSEILVMYPQLNSPDIELNAVLPLHPVIADETALTQVFSNLLSNAVKFIGTDRKPRVKIWTEAKGEVVRIFISDNGIGIPQRDQNRIFKMFERLQPESKYEGSGIGLTIVRRAVERMGGKIGVESAEGLGSTFWIELRKGDAP